MKFEIGDIFQVLPKSGNEKFRYSLVIATDIESWGITASIQLPGQGIAFVRLAWDEVEFVGKAKYINVFGISDEEIDGWVKMEDVRASI